MSPTQIYKVLIEYLKQSALSVATKSTFSAKIEYSNWYVLVDANKPNPSTSTSLTPTESEIAPVDTAKVKANTEAGAHACEIVMTQITGLVGNFTEEDHYFALMIKAMAAKILTTLGVYDMFNRVTPITQLTPTE